MNVNIQSLENQKIAKFVIHNAKVMYYRGA